MKEIERPFYYGASPEIFKRAEILRKNLTPVEKLLWDRLRKGQVKGIRFKAQHPISKFIVDFYCHKALLVIEIDGDVHDKEDLAERDEGREYELKKLGLRVIRFKNAEVMNNMDKVLVKIHAVINKNI